MTLDPPLGERRPDLPLRGREKHLKDLTALVADGPDYRMHVVHGMHGCGKSALILDFVYHALHQHNLLQVGRVWWVDARQSASLEAGLRAVAREAGASETALRADNVPDVLWRHLNRLRGRWLLVIDNADDPSLLDGPGSLAAGTGWIRQHNNPGGLVIVTSCDRTQEVWGRFALLRPIHALEDHDAAQVLLDHTHDRAGSRGQAVSLARRLGGLPRSLRMAGSYLSRTTDTPAMFLDPGTPTDFSAYRQALGDGLKRVDSEQVMVRTWQMSLDLLEQRGFPRARPLLQLLATFADAPIPCALLRPSTLAQTEALAGIDGAALWELLQALAGLSLIDLTPGSPTGSKDLHTILIPPLIRDTSRASREASSLRSILNAAITVAHRATYSEDLDRPNDPSCWPEWQVLAPHIFELADEISRIEDLHEADLTNIIEMISLCSRYLQARGVHSPRTREQFEAAVAICRSVLGDDQPHTLAARNSLAVVLAEQGLLQEARDQFEAILRSYSPFLSDDHVRIRSLRHDLASVLRAQGHLSAARSEFEAVLTMERNIFSGDDPQILTTRHNLALTLRDQGYLGDALREFEEILDACSRILKNSDHPDALTTRYELAVTLRELGRVDQACREFENVMTARSGILGNDHPQTVIARVSLARALGTMPQWAGTIEEKVRAHQLVDECMIIGDSKQFAAALITIDPEYLACWAEQHDKPADATIVQLKDDPDLIAAIQQVIDDANTESTPAEGIRKFRILDISFTEESGHMTPSLKLKRGTVAMDFANEIEALYASLGMPKRQPCRDSGTAAW